MNKNKMMQIEALSKFAQANGIDSFKTACQLADSRDSKNHFFIAENVTNEIQLSILPLLNNYFDYLNQNGVKADSDSSYKRIVGGVSVENNNEVFDLDFLYPYPDQVVSFESEQGRLLRLYILKQEKEVFINFTMSEKGVHNDVGIIIYDQNTINLRSPENFVSSSDPSGVDRSRKFFIILAMVKALFEKLLNKKYKYEVKHPTKMMKKRKAQPIKTSFKYITLDYMSLDEIKTVFKYESRNIQGTAKSPHDRASHIRKLKSGKEVLVKSSKVRGGAKVAKFVNIK
ncbi:MULTISPECIES: hypothetical protein [unclassified Acinetobacter]|uniref:hypothetical protein n=1 Tax=unclassified Acinetobacter TaxID=196816 RepID=UPI0015D0F9F5|nr:MULTISPECIES: hypothetical protein [unclassified Acinetobacter]